MEIVLKKSEFLLNKLTDVVKVKNALRSKSKVDGVKKSALSESVALYKFNQLKEKLEKPKVSVRKAVNYHSNSSNIICGDFKFKINHGPREKRVTAIMKK
jgi:hypothetical protein